MCFSDLKLTWCLATFWLVVMCVLQTWTWSSVWQHSDWLWCVFCRPELEPVLGNILTGFGAYVADLKKTIAVLLESILARLDRLEIHINNVTNGSFFRNSPLSLVTPEEHQIILSAQGGNLFLFFACRLSVCLVSYVGGIDGWRKKNMMSMLNDVHCACLCLTVNSWYLSCSLRPVNAVHFKL